MGLVVDHKANTREGGEYDPNKAVRIDKPG